VTGTSVKLPSSSLKTTVPESGRHSSILTWRTRPDLGEIGRIGL
jgi:hypothetical protein